MVPAPWAPGPGYIRGGEWGHLVATLQDSYQVRGGCCMENAPCRGTTWPLPLLCPHSPPCSPNQLASGFFSAHRAPHILSTEGLQGGLSWPHDYPLSPFIHVRVTVPYFLCCAFQNLQLFSWFTCDRLTTTWEPLEGGTVWASFTSGPQPGTWSNNRVTTARVKMGLAGVWAVCGLSIPLVFKPRKAAFWRCPCKLSANLCAPQKGRQPSCAAPGLRGAAGVTLACQLDFQGHHQNTSFAQK